MAKLGQREDISGRVFHCLTVIEFSHRKEYPSGQFQNIWKCVCECGTETLASLSQLKNGKKKSCGCKASEFIASSRTTHGHASHRKNGRFDRTYLVWRNMKARCMNPKSDRYSSYGGRGISVCERWLKFENFLVDMGECAEGMSLERRNVDGDYTTDNCMWIPSADQLENKQRTIRITFNGKTQSLARWARELGFVYLTLYDRYKKGLRGNDLFRKVQKS